MEFVIGFIFGCFLYIVLLDIVLFFRTPMEYREKYSNKKYLIGGGIIMYMEYLKNG